MHPHLVPHRLGDSPAEERAGTRHRPRRRVEKKWIEDAYRAGEATELPVWCTDQAGPFQTVPYPGQSWRPETKPARQPREYLRDGTAKVLTFFHPADGRVRIKGVTACPNTVLHGWLEHELSAVLAAMPATTDPGGTSRRDWERWQDGLTIKPTLLEELPPLRMLLAARRHAPGSHSVEV